MKKLDGQRSYDESRSYGKYYRINDSDELCVRIDFPEEAENIQESIIVAPIEGDSSSSRLRRACRISPGNYRVTSMLVNIDDVEIWRRHMKDSDYDYNKTDINVPSHIERIYFSDLTINSYKDSDHFPQLVVDENSSLFLEHYNDNITGVFSKDKTEFFKYNMVISDLDEYVDIILPDGLITIHNYAFMNANIGTLRIPASVKEIGKKAFLYAKIKNIIFEGQWTGNIDPEAFDYLTCEVSIRINDTAQKIDLFNELLEAVGNDCKKLTLAAPPLCKETSPAIGYIRATQVYYRDSYFMRWNNTMHNEGIIDINTRYIVSVKEYDIPTYTPVKGSIITLYGCDNDRQHYCVIVYEPVDMILKKIDTAVRQINATGCTIDELIDRIKNRIK